MGLLARRTSRIGEIADRAEPTGPNVIRSASGIVAHVRDPLGQEVTRSLVTVEVMRQVVEARRAAGIGE